MRSIVSVGPPSMTKRGFEDILLRAGSPAAATSDWCYDAFADYNIDPAFGLAIFHHESTYGKRGVAKRSHNWGNLRWGKFADEIAEGWAWYQGPDAWYRSAKDAARLLQIYDRDYSRFKPLDILKRWAPSEDGNEPTAYADAVIRDVRIYRAFAPRPTEVPALEGWPTRDPTFDPRFLQRNDLWASRVLGTAPWTTIGGYGCLLCAAAHMVEATGHLYWSPWELNKWLVENGGYEDHNLLRFASLESIAPISFISRHEYNVPFTHEDAAWARGLFEDGCHILIKVDFDLYRAGAQQHWLHLVRIVDDPRWPYGRWWAYDPWYGVEIDISSYYSPPGRSLDYSVWGLAIYRVEES